MPWYKHLLDAASMQLRSMTAPTPMVLTQQPPARQTRPPAAPAHAPQHLMIPCPDPTQEDRIRDQYRNRGQFLARQENWEALTAEIRVADRARSVTAGGMPLAELLGYGARADVVAAVEHALMDGKPEKGAPVLAGIEALEDVLAGLQNDPCIAAVVAQAHMDIGWAWRGNGWDAQVPTKNRAAFQAHFDRAGDILAEHSADDSPLIMAATCAHLCGHDDASALVASRYEKLIDLNPSNPGPMRAMGNYLLPRWFGDYETLELEARRTAARTTQIWGAGAYTWVMFDAISGDDLACGNLDLEFFVEGLHDILRHQPTQYTVNLLAAYCANTIGKSYSGHDEADHNRSQIADCASWIVRKHLKELHPMIWAHAARGFDNTLRVRSARSFAEAGQADALRIISGFFRTEIAQGRRIIFTADGPMAEHV